MTESFLLELRDLLRNRAKQLNLSYRFDVYNSGGNIMGLKVRVNRVIEMFWGTADVTWGADVTRPATDEFLGSIETDLGVDTTHVSSVTTCVLRHAHRLADEYPEPRRVTLTITLTDSRAETPGAIAESIKTVLEAPIMVYCNLTKCFSPNARGVCPGHVRQRFTVEAAHAKEAR